MIIWNKIAEKLPKINKNIFLFGEELQHIRYGCLRIFDPKKSELLDPKKKLKEGDTYWQVHMKIGEQFWVLPERYPYWLTNKELVAQIIEKTDRLNILDL